MGAQSAAVLSCVRFENMPPKRKGPRPRKAARSAPARGARSAVGRARSAAAALAAAARVAAESASALARTVERRVRRAARPTTSRARRAAEPRALFAARVPAAAARTQQRGRNRARAADASGLTLYVLKLAGDRRYQNYYYYVGTTRNLTTRLAAHRGGTGAACRRSPAGLPYSLRNRRRTGTMTRRAA